MRKCIGEGGQVFRLYARFHAVDGIVQLLPCVVVSA